MRIAYIITAHNRPELLARMVGKLLCGTDDRAFIHIDAKFDIEPFKKALDGIEGVEFIEKRCSVTWGGFSQVRAMAELMRRAVADGSCGRIVFVQSQTYPLASGSELSAFFDGCADKEFIGATDMSRIETSRHLYKFAYNWSLDSKSFPAKLRRRFNTVRMKLKLPSRYRHKRIATDAGEKYDFYLGRAYIALTPEAARYCVDFYDGNPRFNKRFARVYASDESYFHTVLLNSPFADNAYYELCQYGDDKRWYNLTFMDYDTEAVVQTDTAIYDRLRAEGWLFVRKVDLPASAELLDYIDSMHRAAL